MKAIVDFADNTSSVVEVRQSYSKAGIHYYTLTLNALCTFLDFKAGETKTFTESEVKKLRYIMG